MHDICIIKYKLNKAVIDGMTDKGKRWLRSNMQTNYGELPLTVAIEAVEELEKYFIQEGLTVIIR